MDIDFDRLMELAKEKPKHEKATPEQVQKCAEMMVKAGYHVNDRESFTKLARYVASSRYAGYSEKGLLLHGDYGVGKTMFCQMFLQCGSVVSTLDIVNKATGEKMSNVLDYYTPMTLDSMGRGYGAMVIDDLCKDEQEVMSFGSKVRPVYEMIDMRYRMFKRHGWLTHFTMNVEKGASWADMVAAHYDNRILDRINEMCVAVEVKGTSMRG